jgi:dTDP-4-dehydrorhamnose 3,5-epimerase-like enzyme
MTIGCNQIRSVWNDQVIIDEIKSFNDDRGMLAELWRSDDSINFPTMSYWSTTNPLTQRGFHQHLNQTDNFISWFSTMIYQLYNPDTKEMFHFITDQSKIYRVIVKPPIIHSYRNLSLTPALTGNFPSALFKGLNKQEEIDEIRYEESLKDIPTYIIFGSNSQLAKGIIKYLFDNIGFQKYNVIPISKYLYCEKDIDNLFKFINFKNCKFINCAANTNTRSTEDMTWSNITLPVLLSDRCKDKNIDFYQISSDYVYRVNDKSSYTISKKVMEEHLDCKIIRVTNLFGDRVNLLHRLVNSNLTSNPKLYIYPTDVYKLAEEIIKFTNSNGKEINICGKPYTIKEFSDKFLGKEVEYCDINFEPNCDKFLDKATIIDCDEEIKKAITEL